MGVDEFAEENFGVGERAAGGGVGRDGSDGARECGAALTMSWMERTRSSEAMVQPGTMASEGVSEAMGMRPRSARAARSSSAQSEGWV